VVRRTGANDGGGGGALTRDEDLPMGWVHGSGGASSDSDSSSSSSLSSLSWRAGAWIGGLLVEGSPPEEVSSS